uniref:Uncharacterized protein n=1 Tax=viral metagenome TaxID=1070528 RepID=A0A6M3LYU5_9ZZZZ
MNGEKRYDFVVADKTSHGWRTYGVDTNYHVTVYAEHIAYQEATRIASRLSRKHSCPWHINNAYK